MNLYIIISDNSKSFREYIYLITFGKKLKIWIVSLSLLLLNSNIKLNNYSIRSFCSTETFIFQYDDECDYVILKVSVLMISGSSRIRFYAEPYFRFTSQDQWISEVAGGGKKSVNGRLIISLID